MNQVKRQRLIRIVRQDIIERMDKEQDEHGTPYLTMTHKALEAYFRRLDKWRNAVDKVDPEWREMGAGDDVE